jgi:hypothetical protein
MWNVATKAFWFKRNDYLCLKLIIIRFMEYINDFHKQWIERTRQSIASWSKQPASLEEAKKQQERLRTNREL